MKYQHTLPCYKNCIFIIQLGFVLLCAQIQAQNIGTWTWMKGSASLNSAGVYGTMGVPNPANTPPALYEPVEFTDLQGRFWIYGGAGINFNSAEMWMFDPQTINWTWVRGENSLAPTLPTAVYGIQGVPSPLNHPGIRAYGTVGWTDLSGNLWIFGGNGSYGYENDLWKYDIGTNQWTWMKGSNTTNNAGTYGTQGVPNINNNPRARSETAAAWTDNNGDLWLYGGVDSISQTLDDLWRYNIATNTWTWMKGSSIPNAPAVYGVQGVSAPGNTPGGRMVYARWKDANGNLWLHGGASVAATFPPSLQDFWRYSVSNNQWTWIGGNTASSNVFSQKCSPGNGLPPATTENRAVWADDCGLLWGYGGCGSAVSTGTSWGSYNTLWSYNPVSNSCVWLGGDLPVDQPGNYGTQGVPANTNYPPSLNGAVGFKDNQGNFWLFGGFYSQNLGGSDFVNTLWKYTRDPLCPSIGSLDAAFSIDTSTSCSTPNYTFTSNTPSAFANYHWDFGVSGTTADTSSTPVASYTYNAPGTYTVSLILSSSFGCAPSDTATFELVVPVVGLPQSTVTASACGNFTAPWGTVYNQSGTYVDTLTFTNGCDSVFTLNLTINALPAVGVTTQNALCNSSSGTATANINGGTPGFTYLWTPGNATTQTISGLAAGNYSVLITDSKGCTASASAQVSQINGPAVAATSSASGCDNASGRAFATANAGTPPYSFSWFPSGGNSSTADSLPSGSYLITVTDANNCSAQANTVVNLAGGNPIQINLQDVTITPGDSVSLQASGAFSYAWSPPEGLSCTNCANPIATPLVTTLYTVTGIDSLQCKSSALVKIQVEEPCGEVFFPTVFSPDNKGPAKNEILCAYGNCITELTYEIFNRWGQRVFRSNSVNDCWDGIINGVAAEPGAYAFRASYTLRNGNSKEVYGSLQLIR